jgi:hypothetical protein
MHVCMFAFMYVHVYKYTSVLVYEYLHVEYSRTKSMGEAYAFEAHGTPLGQ